MTIKVATVKVFDRDFEEWETHHNVVAIIEQADLLYCYMLMVCGRCLIN